MSDSRTGDIILIGNEAHLVIGEKGKLLLNLNNLKVRTDPENFCSSTLNLFERQINLSKVFIDIIYNKYYIYIYNITSLCLKDIKKYYY